MSSSERVHNAALDLFARKGYQATGIRDIAREANISVATLYNYMGTKEDLLVAIMEHGVRRLSLAATLLIQGVESPVEQLAALVRLHVWTHGVRQKSALVTDTEVRSLAGESLTYVTGLRDSYERLWRDAVRAGLAKGVMTVPDPKLASFALLEMCTGVSHWYRPEGELTLDYICDAFVDSTLGLTRSTVRKRPARNTDMPPIDLMAHYQEVDRQLAVPTTGVS